MSIKKVFKTSPYDLSFIKSIFEGYDNVAVMTTVSAKDGVFELVCPDGMKLEAMEIINKLKVEEV